MRFEIKYPQEIIYKVDELKLNLNLRQFVNRKVFQAFTNCQNGKLDLALKDYKDFKHTITKWRLPAETIGWLLSKYKMMINLTIKEYSEQSGRNI